MGSHVEAYVELIVPYLIESMVSNNTLNYLSFHVDTESKDAVDEIRKSNVIKSDKMDCIRICVDYTRDVNSLIQKVIACQGGSETRIAVSLTIQHACLIGKVDRADAIIKKFIDDPLVIAALFPYLKNIDSFLDYLGEQLFEKDMSKIYYHLIKKNRDLLSTYADKVNYSFLSFIQLGR